MALLVEDGTGLADAESYVTVAAFRAYATSYGQDVTAKTDAECEVQLRLAAQWIDTRWRYKGVRLKASQALEFPRSGLTDWSGYKQTGVPARVARATSELAIRGLAGTSLVPDLDRSAWIKSESVGPISTTYADGAPQSTVFSVVERLLEQFARDPDQQSAPFFGGATEGAFALGMMGNPLGSNSLSLTGDD